MAKIEKVNWKFPTRNVFYMRLEIFLVVVLTGLIFFLSFGFTQGWYTLLYAMLFLALYIVIANLMQIIRQVEEAYQITASEIKIHRKTRFSSNKIRVPLKNVTGHKLDKWCLGGYIFTKEGPHMLYFNTKKELEGFENILKKYIKLPKKHK
jgi:hypothetical protein